MSDQAVEGKQEATEEVDDTTKTDKNAIVIVIHETDPQDTPMDASNQCFPAPLTTEVTVDEISSRPELKAPGMF